VVRPARSLWTLPLTLTLVAGCAQPRGETFPQVTSTVGFPVRLAGGLTGPLEIASPPRRILPGNAAFVDFVAAILGPDRVVAVPRAADAYSPSLASDPAWKALPRFEGFDGELILALEPDLVLAHPWQTPEMLAGVRTRGIPVLVLPLPTSWADVLATLELLGHVSGEEERAQVFLAELQARRERLRRSSGASRGLRALSYTNLGTGGSVAGRGTTADILFELAGMENAAGEAGLEGHADLDLEGLLALDPDLIVVGDRDSPETNAPSASFLLENEGLRDLRAVRDHRILSLPAALFSSASFELLGAAERLVIELELAEGLVPLPGERFSSPRRAAAPGSPPGGS